MWLDMPRRCPAIHHPLCQTPLAKRTSEAQVLKWRFRIEVSGDVTSVKVAGERGYYGEGVVVFWHDEAGGE